MMHFDFDLRSPCGHCGMEWRREFHLFNLGKLVESSHADAGHVDRSIFHRSASLSLNLSIEMIHRLIVPTAAPIRSPRTDALGFVAESVGSSNES